MEKHWFKQYPLGIPEEIDPDKFKNVPEILDEAVERFGDQTAYIHRIKDFERKLTFRELDKYSRDFASYLQNFTQLEPGDKLAIQMPNLLQYPIVLFGALRAGLTVVNTNPLYTHREMEHQFVDADAKGLVILDMFQDKLPQVLPKTGIKTLIIASVGDMFKFPYNFLINNINRFLNQAVPFVEFTQPWVTFQEVMKVGSRVPFEPMELEPDSLAFLQYTGGTTGVSKGAMLTHRNIVANVEQIASFLGPFLEDGKERVVTPLPLYHVFALTCNCLAFVKFGGSNLLITNPRDMDEFLRQLSIYEFTALTGVNTLFSAMMNHEGFENIKKDRLKFSIGGAMALQSSVVQQWKEKTGSPLIEGYGLTEASPVVTVNRLDGKAREGTIGLPLPSTDVKLVEEDGSEVTELDTRGEIYVKGPQVMQGYYNRPEETENTLTEDAWLRTGDIAVWKEDYFLKIVDRKKDMILVSGFNVYPNEVEDVIASFPGVLEVACIGVPDPKSTEAVKAIYRVKPGESVDEAALRKYAEENLTGYKRPKYYELRHEELPKSNVGKILRRVLREEEDQAHENQASGEQTEAAAAH